MLQENTLVCLGRPRNPGRACKKVSGVVSLAYLLCSIAHPKQAFENHVHYKLRLAMEITKEYGRKEELLSEILALIDSQILFSR